MLVKSDSEKEKKIVEDIITNDEQLKQQHELFVAEMAFKQEMINARKTLSLTQKDVSRLSGLSQQAVSRIENGASGTISTVIKYLNSLGYTLSIKKNC
ncbi:HTH domain-containing protein [Butyrivibrio proteoclasticus B316]|uniref:HTH domain-containing protein n=1 Tax=Butyrivibrio proteoclasticus (strain ATCC 51982 / DSM 14932 / B316) TaxID=515622 RepID=E0RWY9_BUTPB|nr:helix-turn-helix transcriptional regulator [Butyrivibrio proteoclasticus]ADL34897.1 HTH domain-containing protein [Butyrivibrio proteoclasticus B316]